MIRCNILIYNVLVLRDIINCLVYYAQGAHLMLRFLNTSKY